MSDYVLFASRPGFEDLLPIAQAESLNSLVPIAYTLPYRDAMDTFRALVKKNEKSARGLEITEVLIRLNPGHFSIWAFRAETLFESGADLTKELDLMDELIKEHLKSYQVWQHRRNIVTALESSTRELAFTQRALSFDSKNYHTWAYRQWALCHFFSSASSHFTSSTIPKTSTAKSDLESIDSIWSSEIAYIDQLLKEDIRNNSAWNHRFFVAFESGQGGEETLVLERELTYTKEKLALAPNNPSAWNYLRGVLDRTSTPFSAVCPFVTRLAIPSSAQAENEPLISPLAQLPAYLAIEFLADAAEQEAKSSPGDKSERAREAAALFRSLIQYDPIRTKYWEYRAAECI